MKCEKETFVPIFPRMHHVGKLNYKTGSCLYSICKTDFSMITENDLILMVSISTTSI